MSKTLFRRSAWLALFAVILQFGLPLAHFCALDSAHLRHDSEPAVTATTPLPPSGQTRLQEAPPLPLSSPHDHATCPICRSLQRLGASELPVTQVWTSPRLTGAGFTPFHLVSFFQQPAWNTPSPRGPPRNS
jgi:hypothetical protein